MYKLYGGKFTRALIVQMVMAEGIIDYEYVEVDIANNEHRKAEFLAINTAGFVPVLIKTDGWALSETPAINLYLCEQHRLTHLAPDIDDQDRGLFLSSLFYLSDDLEAILLPTTLCTARRRHSRDETKITGSGYATPCRYRKTLTGKWALSSWRQIQPGGYYSIVLARIS